MTTLPLFLLLLLLLFQSLLSLPLPLPPLLPFPLLLNPFLFLHPPSPLLLNRPTPSPIVDDPRVSELTALVNQLLRRQEENDRNVRRLMGVIEEKNERLREMKKKSGKVKKEAKESSASTVFSPFRSSPSNSPSKTKSEKDARVSDSESVEERDEREKKSAKPLKLTGISIYDGKSSFKKWLKRFELKVAAGNHSDAVKFVTLLEYLSPQITDFLAELDRESFSSYSLLVNLLLQEHRSYDPMGGTTSVQTLLAIHQESNECVSSFAARLAAGILDCGEMELHGTEFEKNCFIDGLKHSIQVKVREHARDEDIECLLKRAKEVEDNEAYTKAALTRHNKKSPSSPPPSTPPSSPPHLCTTCKTNTVTPPHKLCSTCFAGKKEKKPPTNNNRPKICTKCSVNPANIGYNWCESCYQNNLRAQSHSSSPPPSKSSHPPSSNNRPADYWISNKVRYLPQDDNSSDPLLWSSDKLKKEERCLFCAIQKNGHTAPLCKEAFPHYHPAEVRALKSKSLEIPVRTGVPSGSPKPV